MKNENIISINGLSKTYSSGLLALNEVNLSIKRREIFALLGPNGAGKTTLINAICGIINPSRGEILADGHNVIKDYRLARTKIGLVPQELSTDMFEKVWDTVKFSRGLYGKPQNDSYLEKILKDLALWNKKDSKIMTLSGGMKRRVMIAKALSHEPEILFLDEPSAGVDVELRREMWQMVRSLRENGVTIILTTHYIHEAEEMADRVGVINNGKIIIVEEKAKLMKMLGKKEVKLTLYSPLTRLPDELKNFDIQLSSDYLSITFTYNSKLEETGIALFLKSLHEHGILIKDLQTKESSLEEIFVQLVEKGK